MMRTVTLDPQDRIMFCMAPVAVEALTPTGISTEVHMRVPRCCVADKVYDLLDADGNWLDIETSEVVRLGWPSEE